MLTLLMLTWISSALLPLFLKQSAISPKKGEIIFSKEILSLCHHRLMNKAYQNPKSPLYLSFVPGWMLLGGVGSQAVTLTHDPSRGRDHNNKIIIENKPGCAYCGMNHSATSSPLLALL